MEVLDDRWCDGMKLAAAADAVESGIAELQGRGFLAFLNGKGGRIGHLVAG